MVPIFNVMKLLDGATPVIAIPELNAASAALIALSVATAPK